MVPLIEKIKKTYHLKQLIVVADRGLNSCQNLFDLKDIGCDFVIAQKFRTTSDTKKQILDQETGRTSFTTKKAQRYLPIQDVERKTRRGLCD